MSTLRSITHLENEKKTERERERKGIIYNLQNETNLEYGVKMLDTQFSLYSLQAFFSLPLKPFFL